MLTRGLKAPQIKKKIMKKVVEIFREEVELGLIDNASQTYCDNLILKMQFDKILNEKGVRKKVMDKVENLVEYLIEKK